MHPEKYSLTWHTYSDHLKSMMKELIMNEDFSDVTLVTEDKKQIKANINILSAFKDILKKEKVTSTVMYLRGIQYSIMQFIYLGEATFYEERMDEFLSVAKVLEIKELCNAEAERNEEPEDEPLTTDSETFNENLKEQTIVSDHFTKKTKQERRREVTYLHTFSLNMKVLSMLVVSVTIKLLYNLTYLCTSSQSMKALSMLVFSVTNNLHRKVLKIHTFSQSMTVSNMLVINVTIYLHLNVT